MTLNDALQIAHSGLDMQRARIELIASNLANAQVTRTDQGGPYQRRMLVVRAESLTNGFNDTLGQALKQVRVEGVQLDERAPVLRYEPGHPDADVEGYVAYPNVEPVEEVIDLVSASRSYEANVNVFKTIGQLQESALNMVR